MVVSVRLTVLGACGAWPEPGQACSGFLVEQDGFRLLVDAGYATMPRLLEHVPVGELDAVFISHGHPDHCADLNPLLRARAMGGDPAPPLPVYALPGALDAVLALDHPGTLAGSFTLCEIIAGRRLGIGPFDAETCLLPHWVPNVGLRLAAGGAALAYTGDSGPDLASSPWPAPRTCCSLRPPIPAPSRRTHRDSCPVPLRRPGRRRRPAWRTWP